MWQTHAWHLKPDIMKTWRGEYTQQMYIHSDVYYACIPYPHRAALCSGVSPCALAALISQ